MFSKANARPRLTCIIRAHGAAGVRIKVRFDC